MKGFEPLPRFSRERILSPLRLPFRHIGAPRSTRERAFNFLLRFPVLCYILHYIIENSRAAFAGQQVSKIGPVTS
jgi:hypothetical protein